MRPRVENGQVCRLLCPLLIKISSTSAQWFGKADLETRETQREYTEGKRHTQKRPYTQERQMEEPKRTRQRWGVTGGGGGGGGREKPSAGVRQAEIGDKRFSRGIKSGQAVGRGMREVREGLGS